MNKKFLIGATIFSSAVAAASLYAALKLNKLNDELIETINDMIDDEKEKFDPESPVTKLEGFYVRGPGCEKLKVIHPHVGENFKVEINYITDEIRFVDPKIGLIWFSLYIKSIDIQEDHITFIGADDHHEYTINKVRCVNLEEAHKIYDEEHKGDK